MRKKCRASERVDLIGVQQNIAPPESPHAGKGRVFLGLVNGLVLAGPITDAVELTADVCYYFVQE